MKKIVLSTAMLFVLSFTAGVMAQDAKPAKQEKAKTECCKENKDKKDKKDKKDSKKSCCSDKKAADKSKTDKK